MDTPKSLDAHQAKYSPDAWKQYSLMELGNFVHLLTKRAGHRSPEAKEKAQKDLDDAQNYLSMMQAHLDECKAKFK